jgi:alpha-L-fucosidase
MAVAKEFNPTEFDARAIAKLAKAAGMKWIIITSKHHDGFAMFDSKHPFNIVDATPFGRDPMKELAEACRAEGLGFGFYYSHYQDWTAPGGRGGPENNADGSPATFADYFKSKCYPQVDEICSNYGPLSFVWFDTPGRMPKEDVEALAKLVRSKQPQAMLCSRIGKGLGDYRSLGDMEIPLRNHDGLWETCDTTNDSWSYAWYDQNWKDSKQILHRLVSTVGRGGTYLLNIGPDQKGRVPAQAQKFLERSGEWISRHPEVVYNAAPSPWGRAQPWGDITRSNNTLNLVIFDWPTDRQIWLSGIQGEIATAKLHQHNGNLIDVPVRRQGDWAVFDLSKANTATVQDLAGRLQLEFNEIPEINTSLALHPNLPNTYSTLDAKVKNARQRRVSWMSKFGEWKFAHQVNQWDETSQVTWEFEVAQAGDYHVELTYKGEDRVIWNLVCSDGGELQNEQPAASVYHAYAIGILTFSKPGKHTVTARLVKGNPESTSLKDIRFSAAH